MVEVAGFIRSLNRRGFPSPGRRLFRLTRSRRYRLRRLPHRGTASLTPPRPYRPRVRILRICNHKKAPSRGAFFVVEVAGFEPAAFWSRTKRATKLRYTSKKNGADKGTRTLDLMITNQPLYHLSYIGTRAYCQRQRL